MDRIRKQFTSIGIKPNRLGTLGTTLGAVASLIVLLLTSSSAGAATLNVVGGQLLGASGVIVDGSAYNVEFLDGTCIALYSGCDDVSDFTFQSAAVSNLASEALKDQVFLDTAEGQFNSSPWLTEGCDGPGVCVVTTAVAPTGLLTPSVAVSVLNNFSGDTNDTIRFSSFRTDRDADFTGTDDVYAVWSLVPEPGTAVLMGLGLLGLSVRKRREG